MQIAKLFTLLVVFFLTSFLTKLSYGEHVRDHSAVMIQLGIESHTAVATNMFATFAKGILGGMIALKMNAAWYVVSSSSRSSQLAARMLYAAV